MKTNIAVSIVFALIVVRLSGQKVEIATKAKLDNIWTVKNPFEHNVFIENKGQFTEAEKAAVGDPILFYSRKGKVHFYFTKHSIVFRYDSIYKEKDKEDSDRQKSKKEDDDENIRVKHLYMKMNWASSNPNTKVETEKPLSDYFTYNNPNNKTGRSGIKALAYKKIIYQNLYPGVDLEVLFSLKDGNIEYNYIIHPGANPTDIKIQYDKNAKLKLAKHDLYILSTIGNFIYHSPILNDENGSEILAQFSIQNNTVSYNIRNYDKSKPLTILTWETSTSFAFTNKSYDIDCDKYGNVYIYGGRPPFQLQKYNEVGSLLWTYTTGFTGSGGVGLLCGDLAVDVRNGTSYICDGGNYSGCQIAKVNTLGILNFLEAPSDSIGEMWRINIDYCNNELVIGAGTPSPYTDQAVIVDTTLTNFHQTNILNASSNYNDICLLAMDNIGNAYFANALGGDTSFNNFLLKEPLPLLGPPIYKIHDNYHFHELSIPYYAYTIFYSTGFNGMAANKNAVFTYDGSTLKRRNPAMGALQDSMKVTDSSFMWGGLDIDCEENVYAGAIDSIIMFDSNLTRIGFAKLLDTIYALKVGYTGQVYACGNGFVCSLNALVPSPTVTATCSGTTSCAGCNGTATANLSCGIYPFEYQWSDGETTQTITGLCPGTYTVTINRSCLPFSDTAVVTISGKAGILVSHADTNPQCTFSKGSITAYPVNGLPPYTYLWSNGTTSQTDTGLVAGSYYCVITDNTGCKDTVPFTLVNPPPPDITIVSYHDSICKGCPDTIIVNGAKNYSWNPSKGLSCSDCPNPIATLFTTTTYTVTGTDSLGCESEKIITILVDEPCQDLIIPNVITPNGDRINDVLEISATNFEQYSIIIYDRWGRKMYNSTDPTKYWDGTTETGTKAPDGIYYYILNYICQGHSYNKNGFVQLIR